MAKKVTAATMDGELSKSVQQTILWTAHHASMQRSDSSTLPTIKTILPVVDHVSNDIDFQFHVMKLAMEYMNYINPGHTTVAWTTFNNLMKLIFFSIFPRSKKGVAIWACSAT